MLSRWTYSIPIGLLVFQMACAKTVDTIRPESQQDPNLSLPLKVEVMLKNKVSLEVIGVTGGIIHQGQQTTWETDRISGSLVAWNDEVVSIKASSRRNRRRLFGRIEVPIEYIERIDIKEADLLKSCLIGGVVSGGIIAAVIAVYAEVYLTPD